MMRTTWVMGYGLGLVVLGALAATLRGPGVAPEAPLLTVAFVQFVVLAVMVPYVLVSGQGTPRAVRRLLTLALAGFVASILTAIWGAPFPWRHVLVLETLVVSFVMGVAGVSLLMLAVVRRPVLAQLVSTAAVLSALMAPLLVTPLVQRVGSPGALFSVTGCVSPVVASGYCVGVDFYRAVHMYSWIPAGSYPFTVPTWPVTALLYVGCGTLLTLVAFIFLPRRPVRGS